MKAVMYHYVRGETRRPPDYYYLDIDDFRKQLDYFENNVGLVNQDDFIAAITGQTDTVPSGVVLTFDDGLRDHYDVVFPELQKRNLWGIFYIPTGIYQNKQLLDVHRTHMLLAEVSGQTLLSEAQSIVEEKMIPHENRDEYRTETYKAYSDTEATKQVKRILNYFIADEYQTEVLDRLIKQVPYDPIDVSEYYAKPAELREMHDAGMIIGGHTVTHPVLSKLSYEEQRDEIGESLEFLTTVLDESSVRTFCYPYGGTYTFNDDTISILKENGCQWCFKVESRDITQTDINEHRQALPRYDCNEFPHGAASGSIGSS
jgi:peptidoglycan/xylan/chitin deacetylase (PgdA/CDA1 family)